MADPIKPSSKQTPPSNYQQVKLPGYFKRFWIRLTAYLTGESKPFAAIAQAFSDPTKNIRNVVDLTKAQKYQEGLKAIRENPPGNLKGLYEKVAKQEKTVQALKNKIESLKTDVEKFKEGAALRDAEDELRSLKDRVESEEKSLILSKDYTLPEPTPLTKYEIVSQVVVNKAMEYHRKHLNKDPMDITKRFAVLATPANLSAKERSYLEIFLTQEFNK